MDQRWENFENSLKAAEKKPWELKKGKIRKEKMTPEMLGKMDERQEGYTRRKKNRRRLNHELRRKTDKSK